MSKKNIRSILEKIDSGRLDPEEEQAVHRWLLQLNQKKELHYEEGDIEEVSAAMWKEIKERSFPKNNLLIWRRVTVAASIILLATLSILLYIHRYTDSDTSAYVVQHDISPGTQGATLTLANGKKIRLTAVDDGQLIEETGVTITKSVDGKLTYQVTNIPNAKNIVNTLHTEQGETYQVKLSDGSIVWLNSASSLTYSTHPLTDGKRVVKLKGEAYFDVVEDRMHPFIVETTTQNVEVLGTQFNINSYDDETVVATTLIEGSVKVKANDRQTVLQPGQQARTSNGIIQVSHVDIDQVIDWKNGDFNLDGLDFRAAMRKIARWYNVDVIFNESVPENMESGGWISRNQPLSNILRLIESSGQVTFKLEGNKLYVMN